MEVQDYELHESRLPRSDGIPHQIRRWIENPAQFGLFIKSGPKRPMVFRDADEVVGLPAADLSTKSKSGEAQAANDARALNPIVPLLYDKLPPPFHEHQN